MLQVLLCICCCILICPATQVKERSVVLQMPDKTIAEVPCGLVIWAAGNKGRDVTQKLMAKLPEDQKNKRGITVDGSSHFSSSSHPHSHTHRPSSNERDRWHDFCHW